MKKKLNALTVSGLMIGPILGSGIVFLPPLAHSMLKEQAIIAWLVIMALGALFAYVFAKMTIIAPDNQGISVIVGRMLGEKFRVLSANYLTAAVVFGPVAVALTAADFLKPLLKNAPPTSYILIAGLVLIVCALLVTSEVSFMGKFMLVLSSFTACLLLICGLATLFKLGFMVLPSSLPEVRELGYTLLLIFWAIVGWEVLANFVEDVDDPSRTMMRAIKISLPAIIAVYLVTCLALQSSPSGAMESLFVPVFGPFSGIAFGALAAGLCVCTVVTFTGAVSRQTAARLQSTSLPAFFRRKNTPVFLLLGVNLIILALNFLGILAFDDIVGTANTMFIANAFLGLLSGFRLIKSAYVRIGIGLLLVMLAAIFLFSSPYSLVLFALITIFSLLKRKTA